MNKQQAINKLKELAKFSNSWQELNSKLTAMFQNETVQNVNALTAKLWENKINEGLLDWPLGLTDENRQNVWQWFRIYSNQIAKALPDLDLRFRIGCIEGLFTWKNELYVLLYYQSDSTDTSHDCEASKVFDDKREFSDRYVDHNRMEYVRDPDDAIFYTRVYGEDKEQALEYIFDRLRKMYLTGKF